MYLERMAEKFLQIIQYIYSSVFAYKMPSNYGLKPPQRLNQKAPMLEGEIDNFLKKLFIKRRTPSLVFKKLGKGNDIVRSL